MIWGQLIWGAILAGLLGCAFHRAWKWEHGAAAEVLFGEKNGRETFVLVPPTVLFWILLLFLVLYVRFFGMREGLVHFAALAAEVTLLICVYFPLLLLLLPLLRQHFSARACAVLWLVPAFLTWQANMLITVSPLPRLTLYLPRRLMAAAGAVWLAGFLAVGGCYLFSHLRFRAWVRRHSSAEQEEEARMILKREQEALEYLRPVKLLRSDVPAPFSMGKTRRSRCTVLPKRDYTAQELTMIFRHELHHLQRCDVDTKTFLCLCNALCWFNPLVWLATKKASEDLERSCDEIVTEEMEEGERRAYANLLLDAAAPGRGFTTCLSAAAGTLRYRLKSVMDRRRRSLGTALLMASLFLCVMCFGLVSVSDARGSFASLLLTPEAEILNAYDSRVPGEMQPDGEALREVLEGIRLTHLAGLRKPLLEGDRITFRLSGGRFVFLTDRVLLLQDLGSAARSGHAALYECYLVESPIDWEALRACCR